jgi:hypothetical protein
MTDDDPLTIWQQQLGSLRKRGRISSAALSIIPSSDTDARFSRPSPPAGYHLLRNVSYGSD